MTVRVSFAATVLCWIAVGSRGSAQDRYVAWLADGTKQTTSSLSAWPIPGSPARLENQDIWATANPVRLIRDRRAGVTLKPPFLVLANGDILAGAPLQLEPDAGRIDSVPRLRIQLEPPLLAVTGASISLRTDRIARIVSLATSEQQQSWPPQRAPGTAVLVNGRQLIARSIRWREGGLSFLTAEGVVDAAFADLVDVVFPRVDQTAAVLEDSLVALGNPGNAICRFQVTGGSIITASRISREQEQARRRGRLGSAAYYYVQPIWADQPLALPESEIACCGYRLANEIPLSLLPAETLANRRLTGPVQPWLANRSADGWVLATAEREADLGLSAHAHSEIAFTLPPGARSLQIATGMDRSVGDGGCARCKVAGGKVLWDSGVFQGRDGIKATGPLDVTGLARVVLMTEFAALDRPPGADPLDIRDQVAWLNPLIKLDPGALDAASRANVVLTGFRDWQFSGSAQAASQMQIANRWNLITSSWDSVVTLPQNAELHLERLHRVTAAADVLELLTSPPAELGEHDFRLTVDGVSVPWTNNADRAQLRQWLQRYGRTRARDEDENSRNNDYLAYWWDLSPWRGREVTLRLTLHGTLAKNEIVWRGLSLRSPVMNLLADGTTPQPDVLLTTLDPIEEEPAAGRSRPLKGAIPQSDGEQPIRFLGQPFIGGYGMARNSSIQFALKPEYKRFVAVAGCCYQMAGPLRVLLDERVVWERATVSSLAPAETIDVPIPRGARSLTLQFGDGPHYGLAAFARAGFMTR